MNNRWFKIVVYVMLFALLTSTILMSVGWLFE
ncbi:stressosome-associated protein Prli42 [Cohnella faecalis]|uniref:DUF4044 domain-containing protein n=1 Tax=Cohnella faecalis TaxID=2315694 RepID=A0A398CMH6_9BACL|nr:stressosome-associated protein Prli42 [Cohnella faecalis]RIE04566.1 DUF4044 domain-containing protein [Cohnella faecalis]